MPCLIALLALIAPRFVIILLWLFSGYLAAAYTTVLWPVLGFFFMPYTTLAYAVAMNNAGSVSGAYLVLVVFAVLVDLGSSGGGAGAARQRG
jgi:hypothetical protein